MASSLRYHPARASRRRSFSVASTMSGVLRCAQNFHLLAQVAIASGAAALPGPLWLLQIGGTINAWSWCVRPVRLGHTDMARLLFLRITDNPI